MKLSNHKTGAWRSNSPSVEVELAVGISRRYDPKSADPAKAKLLGIEMIAYGPDGRTYQIDVTPAEAHQMATSFGYLKGTRYDVAVPRSGSKPPASFEVLAFDEKHARELARKRYADQCGGLTPDAIHLTNSGRE